MAISSSHGLKIIGSSVCCHQICIDGGAREGDKTHARWGSGGVVCATQISDGSSEIGGSVWVHAGNQTLKGLDRHSKQCSAECCSSSGKRSERSGVAPRSVARPCMLHMGRPKRPSPCHDGKTVGTSTATQASAKAHQPITRQTRRYLDLTQDMGRDSMRALKADAHPRRSCGSNSAQTLDWQTGRCAPVDSQRRAGDGHPPPCANPVES